MSVCFEDGSMIRVFQYKDSKSGNKEYGYDYYEFYEGHGWKKLISCSDRYSKEAIEYDFGIVVLDDMEVAA